MSLGISLRSLFLLRASVLADGKPVDHDHRIKGVSLALPAGLPGEQNGAILAGGLTLSAVLAVAASSVVLANAGPSTVLARAALSPMLTDANPSALLARAALSPEFAWRRRHRSTPAGPVAFLKPIFHSDFSSDSWPRQTRGEAELELEEPGGYLCEVFICALSG